MPRSYFRGEIVGEADQPIPVLDWVRGELKFARGLDEDPYVIGRIVALKEVLIRLEN